jgi:ATP-dependent Clp protease ATP-binding subunit ClpB
MGMVRAHFRPEFLNRVDEIILFHRLQKSEMGRIVEIQFGRLQKLLEDRKITLTLDAAARDWLAAKGWDPAYGARPLKRVIQRNLQDPLAEMILAGEGAYIARNISALHYLPPLGPEQERNRTTIVPFPNR